jgi:formamidopyrimidine-DNA glycosylase
MSLDLAQELSGRTLMSFEVLGGRYAKKPIDSAAGFVTSLPTEVVGVGCHGKFMYLLLRSGWNIWSTLGMTGWWSRGEHKHSRIRFGFADGGWVHFNDQRNFGTMKFSYGPTELKRKLQSLGPDMMAEEVPRERFVQIMRKRNNWNVCEALMDQSVVAGVGNYVKAEALWLARIDPRAEVGDLSDDALDELRTSIRNVLLSSFEHDGATFMSHKNFDGDPGSYSEQFLCYGRKIDFEGNPVERLQTPDGRTTHWSPARQLNH